MKVGTVRKALVNTTCKHDPLGYQACGIENSPIISKTGVFQTYGANYIGSKESLCGATIDADDGLLSIIRPDQEHGEKTVKLRSGLETRASMVCNGKCEDWNCEDEAFCGGYTYGVYCPKNDGTELYFPDVLHICTKDYLTYCAPELTDLCFLKYEDQPAMCELTNDNFIYDIKLVFYSPDGQGPFVPVTNFTRCHSISTSSKIISGVCVDQLDQTNCSDPSRVGLECEIHGFLSTVAKARLCAWENSLNQYVNPICDNEFDGRCVRQTANCYVHKHELCDGVKNCEHAEDENNNLCRSQTTTKCRRWSGGIPLTFPLAWLMDGEVDCVGGIDENHDVDIWKRCQDGDMFYYVNEHSVCTNVYICTDDSEEEKSFIRLSDLCDGIETCGNENNVCRASRKTPEITRIAAQDKGDRLSKTLFYCLDGLEGLQKLKGSPCASRDFIYPDGEFLGITKKTSLKLPNSIRDCNGLFGENYIYSSCTGLCTSSSCPLTREPQYDSCYGKYATAKRIGTVANYQYLTFFLQSGRDDQVEYTNDFFVCDTGNQCVSYAQVCDLVKHCYDGSDEKKCTNNFQCEAGTRHESNGTYIAITSKCDGRFDCLDYSDECNDECSSEILDMEWLKVVSWVMGIIAIIANGVGSALNILSMKNCELAGPLACKILINLVFIGDLMVGVYLMSVSAIDSKYGSSYCKEQLSWLTSSGCSTLGVISTIGSELSLFAMTGLSVVRVYGLTSTLDVSRRANKMTYVYSFLGVVVMSATSLLLAILPTLEIMEDSFINGLFYDTRIKLFIGNVDKETHYEIFKQYFGRMRNETLSWATIRRMTSDMFSRENLDVNLLENSKLIGFYGNDGVCLFKYFVKSDDPQRVYSWFVLSVNFICFLVITVSYVAIGLASSDSINQAAGAHQDKRLNDRQVQLNRKISIIIISDFLCWMPFILVALIHFLGLVDATPWYSYFSMIILPINSVINPIVYDDLLLKLWNLLAKLVRGIWAWVRSKVGSISRLRRVLLLRARVTGGAVTSDQSESTPNVEIEMNEVTISRTDPEIHVTNKPSDEPSSTSQGISNVDL